MSYLGKSSAHAGRVLAGLLVVATSGCIKSQLQCASTTTGGSTQNIPAFQSSLYPILTSNCATCHSGSGPGPAAFAGSNVQQAYSDAKSYSSFGTPSSSQFVTTIQGGHNGVSTSVATQIAQAIATWAAAEGGGGSGAGSSQPGCSLTTQTFTTSILTLSATNLPTGTNGQTFNLPVQKDNTDAFGPIGIQITVHAIAAATGGVPSYDISNLIGGTTHRARFSNVQTIVNGQTNPQFAGFENISFVEEGAAFSLTATTWPSIFYPMTPFHQVVPLDATTAQGTLAFQFTVALTSDDPDPAPDNVVSCKALDQFTNVVGIMNRTTVVGTNGMTYGAQGCLSCHGTVGSQANTAFAMSATDTLGTCNNWLQRVNVTNDSNQAAGSFVIVHVNNGNYNGVAQTHQVITIDPTNNAGTHNLTNNEISTIVTWIQAEAN